MRATVAASSTSTLRDDRDVPAEVLDRVLAPASADQSRTGEASG
jgi:hypothetical protein